MAKIRVQDLARMMHLPAQDLIFKLRSIGVRVESEEAGIDSEIIQAILQGKKLPSPREVIMDDSSPAPAPVATAPVAPTPAQRRSQVNPLRPVRPRTIIQKVEGAIKTLPPSERHAAPGTAGAESAEEMFVPASVEPEPIEPVAPATASPPAAAPPSRPAAPPASRPTIYSAAAGARPGTPSAAARGAAAPRGPLGRVGPPGARPTGPSARPAPSARGPLGPARPGSRMGSPRPLVTPGGRPPSLPTSRPGGPGARPGPGGPGSRPGPLGPGARPGTGAPSMPGRDDLRRPLPSTAAPVESPDKKKAKRGVKKPGGTAVSEEDLRTLRGSLQEIEDVVDEAVVPTSARRRRRAEILATAAAAAERAGTPLAAKVESGDGPLVISEGMTLRDFSERLKVKAKDLIKLLFDRGILANINFVIEPELGVKLAAELGLEAKVMTFEEEIQHRQEIAPSKSVGKAGRAPVVTIMGHVDHGKTSLLDAIRSSKVVESEFGGITQHIGAYQVETQGRKIVFLDTPGHEAFTMMRARGARATDIVILVVAADDGMMPQTLEAVSHARAAGVPLVVAINKIDKPNANLERVKKQLADHDLLPEDWGGQTVTVPISAKQRQGIDQLLEMILLTADLLELRADPTLPAQGLVIEARKEVGRGVVATILVQNGTLRIGDVFVSGAAWGRVRAMADDVGRKIAEAEPATPVEVTGFTDLPLAGDPFQVVEEEAKARSIVEFRQQEQRKRELAPGGGRMSLEQLFTQLREGETKELPVVLKADVQGSVEVLRDSLQKLSTDKVKVALLHTGVGAISTNDVLLASASKAVIVGFNVRPERNATELAEKEQVDIRLHTVIYELLDELRKAMTGLLEPTFREVAKGRAEVREIFRVPKAGTVGGCHVIEGTIPRSAGVRLVRDGRVVFEGKISSLKRFKDDASEVRAGFDCGIALDRFQDLKPGDVIEAYVKEEVAAVL